MHSQTFYNITFYSASSLREAAQAFNRKLPEDVTVLISRGSSGNAIASAMLALSKRKRLRHISLRKSGERAHSAIAGAELGLSSEDVGCIVDDFIHTGETVRKILQRSSVRLSYLPIKYILVGHQGNDDVPLNFHANKRLLKIITVDKE